MKIEIEDEPTLNAQAWVARDDEGTEICRLPKCLSVAAATETARAIERTQTKCYENGVRAGKEIERKAIQYGFKAAFGPLVDVYLNDK